MTAGTAAAGSIEDRGPNQHRTPRRRRLLHAFLITMAILWLFPLVYAVYTSLRPYGETARLGYASFGGAYNFDNYINSWNNAELARYFLNTVVIVIPAVIIVLFLASMAAFVLARYSWRFNLLLLMVFTALNLLPPQIIITPLFQLYLRVPLGPPLSDNGLMLYNQYFGIALIHIAFQLGFCTFVLSNYMKTLPKELNEAAIVDGASVWTTYRKVILPLTKPALAALATLEVTFIYNDFFWALMLMKPGPKMPITSALNNLQGQFFTDNNLIAAGAIIIALPTIVVYFILQKQFVGGLALGSTKG